MSEPLSNPFEPFFEKIREIVREEIAKALEPKELYTPEKLSDKLNIPVSWIYEQSRQGNIPTHRLGKYIRFDLQEVLRSQVYQKKVDIPS